MCCFVGTACTVQGGTAVQLLKLQLPGDLAPAARLQPAVVPPGGQCGSVESFPPGCVVLCCRCGDGGPSHRSGGLLERGRSHRVGQLPPEVVRFSLHRTFANMLTGMFVVSMATSDFRHPLSAFVNSYSVKNTSSCPCLHLLTVAVLKILLAANVCIFFNSCSVK